MQVLQVCALMGSTEPITICIFRQGRRNSFCIRTPGKNTSALPRFGWRKRLFACQMSPLGEGYMRCSTCSNRPVCRVLAGAQKYSIYTHVSVLRWQAINRPTRTLVNLIDAAPTRRHSGPYGVRLNSTETRFNCEPGFYYVQIYPI